VGKSWSEASLGKRVRLSKNKAKGWGCGLSGGMPGLDLSSILNTAKTPQNTKNKKRHNQDFSL
jgi:hypothetical protein